MFQWSGSRRCREPPATSGRLVPAAAAVPAATAQQSDDKHDDEQCGEVHNTLLRVPADARCHSCFGCRALQPMINSRITSRFQGVLKRGSAARVQDWGFREAARGAEPCARRNPLLGRGVLTGYAVLPTASITIPTIRATPRPQDCSSLNPHAFRSSIPAIARAASRGEHGERRARSLRRPRCRGAERGRWDAGASHQGSRPCSMGCGPPRAGRAGHWPLRTCGRRLRGHGDGRLGGAHCLATVVVENGARLPPQRAMALQHNRIHCCHEVAGVARHTEG